jgi:hypothetical protein
MGGKNTEKSEERERERDREVADERDEQNEK